MKIKLLLFLNVFFLSEAALANSPKVYFIEPANGAFVQETFKVKFGLEGHHHLLIDTTLTDLKSPIPADSKHIHFGKGQTESLITLEKGEHQLTLVMGNFAHIPHDSPIISETITVIVK
ncbi:MAG: DUF4399 domain-containing protein [Proteobacteria bacterium]|nr:DUF4399 domain-containing protein [Pseudomonadota bacterium]